MSKAVLVSIVPWWCLEIAHGNKTVEVRKNKPNLPTPFKTYIYVTKKRPLLAWGDVFRGNWETEFTTITGRSFDEASRIWDIFNGNIMGEFVCDQIFPLSFYASDATYFDTEPPLSVPGTCLTDKEIAEYLGNGKTGYGWHISDLVIYDEPKKLSDFKRHDPTYDFAFFGEMDRTYSVSRPPQSWCYVEEIV